MKKTRTYIFDALVNLIVQSVLFFIGMFVWVNPVYEVIWALAAAGFAAFLAFMERGGFPALSYVFGAAGEYYRAYSRGSPRRCGVQNMELGNAYLRL